jgi:hypothetical protein
MAALLLLASCDSGPDSGNSVVIREMGEIPDRTIGLRDTLVVDLSEYLSLQTGAIEYTAEASPATVDVEIDGNVLSVAPNESGVASILVHGDAPEATPVEKSFDVTVLCAIRLGLEEADYFPVESDAEWTYDYARTDFDANDPDAGDRDLNWSGTLTLSVTGFTDECGSASIEFTETFDGTYTERDHETQAVEFTEPRTWTETHPASLDGALLKFDAYLEPYGGEFRRIRSSDDEDVVILEINDSEGTTISNSSVLFERNVGITELSNFQTGDDFLESWSMTLIR